MFWPCPSILKVSRWEWAHEQCPLPEKPIVCCTIISRPMGDESHILGINLATRTSHRFGCQGRKKPMHQHKCLEGPVRGSPGWWQELGKLSEPVEVLPPKKKRGKK